MFLLPSYFPGFSTRFALSILEIISPAGVQDPILLPLLFFVHNCLVSSSVDGFEGLAIVMCYTRKI
jgi:hypothetical protein